MGIYVNFADKVSIRVMLPITAVLRGLVNLGVYFIEDPLKGPWFYILVPAVHGVYAPVSVCINGYIQKMFPSEIKGMCMAVSVLFQSIGSFFYIAYC